MTISTESRALQRPRVLYIGAGDPWTEAAGYLQRQMTWLQVLNEIADVTAALFDVKHAGDCPFDMRVVDLQRPTTRSCSRLRAWWNDAVHSLPRSVFYLEPSVPRATILDLEPNTFDAVFSYRIDHGYVAGVLDHPRLLLDVDDPEHVRFAQMYSIQGHGTINSRTRRDLKKLQRFEMASVANAQEAYFCQEDDASHFPKGNTYLAPNTIDVLDVWPERDSTDMSVAYLGNFEGTIAHPNLDGLKWMLDEIWPRVMSMRSDANLLLIGRMGPLAQSMTREKPGVRCLGFVDDVPAALRNVAVSIAPIRIGTGTRVKILDAFACGCPVVSTSVGCAGIDTTDGNQLLIQDDPEEFAQSCVELMENPELRDQIAKSGWEFVQSRFNRSIWIPELSTHLAEKISGLSPLRSS